MRVNVHRIIRTIAEEIQVKDELDEDGLPPLHADEKMGCDKTGAEAAAAGSEA